MIKMKQFCYLLLLFAFSANAQQSSGVANLGRLTYNDIINEVWGWSGNNQELALVGVNSGFSVVDVTNPSNPIQLYFRAGANSIWRDIKTYNNYAYVVHDGFTGNSDGIMIVDLNTIGGFSVDVTNFFPTVNLDGTDYTYTRAHNIYIDENGILYVFGSDVGVGGALMFDLKPNPKNPVYLGAYDRFYLHDGMARGDTLWGAAILNGLFDIIDVTVKSNPQSIASQTTPNFFTHNIWVSDDNKTVYTTDERTNAYVASYDVSNVNNITLLDTIKSSLATNNDVIPHNTHFFNNFLVNSYYTSGLQIVDATIPDILVETAYYDTSPLTGDGYEGAWGAYPYLPSGNILVTDRQEGLFILSTNYPRACYTNFFVEDSITTKAVIGADIEVLNGDIGGRTNIFGNLRDGQKDPGTFQAVVSKQGYNTDTVTFSLTRGVVTNVIVRLLPFGFSLYEYSTSQFSLYPNPSNSFFEVNGPASLNGKVSLTVTDVSGRGIGEYELEFINGEASLEHQLGKGIYLLNFYQENAVIPPLKLQVY